ncbi:MAG: helix-turn-helix domain-containing protein [Synergistaceae bacterium]|nr:helix-turn-helix domain-containing protein [Synergistaceae bacterium]
MQADLAQNVAEVAQATINHHVIITDERGRIIGASQKERVGCLHSPSLEAINRRKEVVTSVDEARRLGDVRPGVTLPIELAGEIVGSVAIAGPPDEVIRFGHLVRREAEVFLKERMLLEAQLLREGARQHLVQEIYAFSGGDMDRDFLLARGREMAIDLALPRLCIVIDLAPFLTGEAKAEEGPARRRIAAEIEGAFRGHQDLTALLGSDKLVVIPAVPRKGGAFLEELTGRCRSLAESLDRRGRPISFGIGPTAEGPEELSQSLRSAWRALVLGRRATGGPGIFLYEDYLLDDLLAGADRRLARTFVRRTLGDLADQHDFDELKTTVRAWMASPFHPGRAAKELAIHRNTLSYRLDKIGRLTGLDLRDFRQLFSLALALRIREHPALAEPKRKDGECK